MDLGGWLSWFGELEPKPEQAAPVPIAEPVDLPPGPRSGSKGPPGRPTVDAKGVAAGTGAAVAFVAGNSQDKPLSARRRPGDNAKDHLLEKAPAPAPAPLDPAEPSKCANAVVALAQGNLKAGWNNLKQEHDTLLLVWQSTSSTIGRNKGQKWHKDQAAREDRLQRPIQDALAASSQDPLGAVQHMDAIKRASDAEGSENGLNAGTVKAVDNLIEIQKQFMVSSKLVDVLRRADPSSQGYNILTPSQYSRDLLALLQDCNLGNNLEGRARKVLGLAPTKADMEAAIKKARAAKASQVNLKIKQVSDACKCNLLQARTALEFARGDVDGAIVHLMAEDQAKKAMQEESQALAQASKEKAARQRRHPGLLEIASAVNALAAKADGQPGGEAVTHCRCKLAQYLEEITSEGMFIQKMKQRDKMEIINLSKAAALGEDLTQTIQQLFYPRRTSSITRRDVPAAGGRRGSDPGAGGTKNSLSAYRTRNSSVTRLHSR